MFAIPHGPVPAPFFTAPRLSRLTVAPDETWYALSLQAATARGGTAWLTATGDLTGDLPADDAGVRRVGLRGRDVTACAGRTLLYVAGRGLWRMPLDGGEAVEVAAARSGIARHAVASSAHRVVYATRMHPGVDQDGDHLLRRHRHDFGGNAVLHDGAPLAATDGDVARQRLRLCSAPLVPGSGPPEVLPELAEGWLTGAFAVDDEARRLVAEFQVHRGGSRRTGLRVAARDRGGSWRWLRATPDGADHGTPVLSPDGRWLACRRVTPAAGSPAAALWIFDLDDRHDTGRCLTDPFDLWPVPAAWSPAGDRLYVTADLDGSCPVFEVDVATGAFTRRTGRGCYEQVSVGREGIYAIRSAVDAPPEPVWIPATGRPMRTLPSLPATGRPDGRMERVSVTNGGHPVRGWLCLPASAPGPLPLLVWLHGGPRYSWTAWSWRWNPWLATARGYAVLLPDPAPSTGYGQRFLDLGWGDWAGVPYAQVMRIVDAVAARPDIDGDRMAVLGASYGGLLACHLAARSGRFRAAVSHAGIWDMRTFLESSLAASAFDAEFSRGDIAAAQSPCALVDSMDTPLLVSHGGRDSHVPFTEALRMWSELRRRGKPAKLLHFPDEGHELADPANVQIWYQSVFAFLEHAIDDRPWSPPALVGDIGADRALLGTASE